MRIGLVSIPDMGICVAQFQRCIRRSDCGDVDVRDLRIFAVMRPFVIRVIPKWPRLTFPIHAQRWALAAVAIASRFAGVAFG